MKEWTSWLWDLIYMICLFSFVYASFSYGAQPDDNEKFCYYRAEFSRSAATIRDLQSQHVEHIRIGQDNYKVVKTLEEYKHGIENRADEWRLTNNQVSNLTEVADYVWRHAEMDKDELFEMYYNFCANTAHAM